MNYLDLSKIIKCLLRQEKIIPTPKYHKHHPKTLLSKLINNETRGPNKVMNMKLTYIFKPKVILKSLNIPPFPNVT